MGTSGSSNGERAVLWTKAGNVRDLETLTGDWASEAVALNNSGEVVGSSKGPRGTRAFNMEQRRRNAGAGFSSGRKLK